MSLTYRKLINDYFAPAFVSALLWCIMWLISFFVLNLWSYHEGFGGLTVAFLVTISVITAHIPKIVSLCFSTDTDFRRDNQGWDIVQLKWWRIILSSSILLAIIFILIPACTETLALKFDPNQFIQFTSVTGENAYVCAALGLLQMVFSWPDVDKLDSLETL